MTEFAPDLPRLTRRLRAWFRKQQRDLPWRRSRDPYRIWISEIMLQQTTVAAVVPYFERFVERFADPAALAQADEQDVLRLWAGLGYYSRARNLHSAAKAIVERFAGRLPDSVDDLRTLPGIGPYTAGAVAAFAFDKPAAVVDTNVARVLARLLRIDGDPRDGKVASRMRDEVQRLLPKKMPGEFSAALMELGATACSPSDPHCPDCPLRDDCGARASGTPTAWPQLKPRRALIDVHEVSAVVRGPSDRFLVGKRRVGDLWAGLWEFPRGPVEPGETVDAAAVRIARVRAGATVEAVGELAVIRHGVTFRRIRLDCRLCTARDEHIEPCAYDEVRWVSLEEAGELPHSSPQKRILQKLRARSA